MIQMSVGPEKQGKKIINISYDDFFAAFSTAGDSNKIRPRLHLKVSASIKDA